MLLMTFIFNLFLFTKCNGQQFCVMYSQFGKRNSVL